MYIYIYIYRAPLYALLYLSGSLKVRAWCVRVTMDTCARLMCIHVLRMGICQPNLHNNCIQLSTDPSASWTCLSVKPSSQPIHQSGACRCLLPLYLRHGGLLDRSDTMVKAAVARMANLRPYTIIYAQIRLPDMHIRVNARVQDVCVHDCQG